jgi:hypothetical protein
MKLIKQIVRIEVEKLSPRSSIQRETAQLIASSKTSGLLYTHRRHFLVGEPTSGYLIRVLPAGEEADTITYGEMDFRISLTPPEVYFAEFIQQMIEETLIGKQTLGASIYAAWMDTEDVNGRIMSIKKMDMGKADPPRLDL